MHAFLFRNSLFLRIFLTTSVEGISPLVDGSIFIGPCTIDGNL